MESLHIFSSNRVERLYEALKVALYPPHSTAFACRLVVVPSPAMKNWLLLRLANDPACSIAAGIEVCYLDQALQRLHRHRRDESALLSSEKELSFLIEGLLRSLFTLIDGRDEEKKTVWEPLCNYLGSSEKGEKAFDFRVMTLSCQLAKMFLQYGRYGVKMLDDWENSVCSKSWQEELWKEIKRFHPSLCLGYQCLPQAIADFTPFGFETQLHLFAMSFIPARVYDFFSQAAEFLPIYYYLLSPCQVFWSDIASDREKIKMQRYWRNKGISKPQQQALDFFLRQRNTLLANFGRMGREIAQQIERYSYQIEECYQLPEVLQKIPTYLDELPPDIRMDLRDEEFSLLHAVHSDILILRNPESAEKINLPATDCSIQLHSSFTHYREVEALYNTLLYLLTKESDHINPLTPADVIVMVPNLSAYAPMINSVFGAESSLLDFQIMEMPLLCHSSVARGFLRLLSLASSRWEAETVLELLECPEFQKRQGFTNAQVQQIRAWTHESGTHWGQNVAHRTDQLTKDYGSCELVDLNPAGTWQYGLSRLLMALVVEPAGLNGGDHSFSPPIEEMESSQAALLAKWIALIKDLQEDLTLFSDNRVLGLNEWSASLRKLLEKYFQSESISKESVENYNALANHLEELSAVDFISRQASIQFASVHFQLKKCLEGELSSYRESHLQAIRFCSLLPMRALPAKVVALIGMNEGVFPRNEIPFSLNEMASHPNSDYFPTQTDFDRYLFLEALLSARRYFILSYVGYSFEEQREAPPSLLVQELLGYLDAGYRIGGKLPSERCFYEHPFDSFDKAYFEGAFPFPTYNRMHHRLAKAFYGKAKSERHCFVKEFSPGAPSPLEEVILLKDLAAFAKNPLKAYFNKALRIYFNQKGLKEVQNQEPFDCSSLDKYQMRLEALKRPVESVLRNAEKRGALPRGLFKEISSDVVVSEVETMFRFFTENGVRVEEILPFSFSEHCEAPFFDRKKGWILPPLSLKNPSGAPFKILGSLKEVCSEGLIFHQARDLKGILGVWPQYLTLCQAIRHYDLPIKPQLISSKSAKPFKLSLAEISPSLHQYLDYYSLGLSTPSPLIPEWTHLFLKGHTDQFVKSLQMSLYDAFSPFYNEYAKWVFRDSQHHLPAEEILQYWQPIAVNLFEGLALEIKG